MTYAIVEAGGKQIRVEAGRFYDVNRLAIDEDGQVVLDKVLFVNNDGEALVGQPTVEGAMVVGSVMRHLRGPKIIVYKMKPKKKTRKKRGHRQELTRVMIESIQLQGKTIASVSAAAASSTDAAAADVETDVAVAES